ncbi:MAG: SH3 domain-containing protein, partial [Treponema sp.]|nr:SH3 domain-containing protein [Treponema sp.]
ETTSSNIITTLKKNSPVKIIQIGKEEIIDGIKSNWVKVEIQKGAKDRDGKSIRAGTVGWVFGGYLE